MYSLLIDGCLDYLELALIENQKIVNFKVINVNKNLTNILNSFIENFLNENNLQWIDIESLYIINGPGSFTSIKLISLFANTIKFVYSNIKLYSLNTLSWFTTSKKELVFVDAKSNLYYFSFYGLKQPLIIFGDEIVKIKTEYRKYIYNFDNKKTILEKWEFNKNNFQLNDFIRPLYLKPAVYDANKKNK